MFGRGTSALWRLHGWGNQGQELRENLVKTEKVRLEVSVCARVPAHLRGIFLPCCFTAQGSLLSLAGRSPVAINFLISSAFPIMDNNRKSVIGF